jgi:hypothetical protein
MVWLSRAFIPMAKQRMICPFTNRLCEECALFRGRHYYLCFYREYRGYLGGPGKRAREDLVFDPGARSNAVFDIPSVIHTSALDPFYTNHESLEREV